MAGVVVGGCGHRTTAARARTRPCTATAPQQAFAEKLASQPAAARCAGRRKILKKLASCARAGARRGGVELRSCGGGAMMVAWRGRTEVVVVETMWRH
uniref:Uncharacterized protein n=1 Tax=Oryza glumipatula TaxID=40148 RepID=A0A0D9ZZ19_9ORYZ